MLNVVNVNKRNLVVKRYP